MNRGSNFTAWNVQNVSCFVYEIASCSDHGIAEHLAQILMLRFLVTQFIKVFICFKTCNPGYDFMYCSLLDSMNLITRLKEHPSKFKEFSMIWRGFVWNHQQQTADSSTRVGAGQFEGTLQGTNISHRGKRKIIFNHALRKRYWMLVLRTIRPQSYF